MNSWQLAPFTLKDEDLIMKREVSLYDNIAQLEGFEGRLRVGFEVDPFPILRWDFESLGRGWPRLDEPYFDGTISGYSFLLEEARGNVNRLFGKPESTHSFAFEGTAGKASVGEQIEFPDNITFFLPNAWCLVATSYGSLFSETYKLVYEKGQKPGLSEVLPTQTKVGDYWEVNLGDDIRVFINCDGQAKKWLVNEESRGTFLTAKASIRSTVHSQDGDCPRLCVNTFTGWPSHHSSNRPSNRMAN